MKYIIIFFPNNRYQDIKNYLLKRKINLNDIQSYVFYPDNSIEIIIKNRINKNKNNNHYIFWWVAAILFLIICFFAGYFYTKNNERIDNSQQSNTKVISNVSSSFNKKYKYLVQITYTDNKDNKEKNQNILCKNNIELNQIKGEYNQVDNSKNIKLKLNNNTTLYSDDICGLRIFKTNASEVKNIINNEGATTNMPVVVNNE